MEIATTTFVPNRRQYERLMLKINDNDRVLEILRAKEEKRQAKKVMLAQCEQQFQPLLATLAEAGFTKVRVNVRLLLKHGGQVEPVMTVLLKRQEKHQERDLKRKSCRADKHEKKHARREDKLARKEEKREKKLHCKEERREKKVFERDVNKIHQDIGELKLDPSVDWTTVQHLFLDGNNMLFVPRELRNLVLKRASRTAELKLGEISRAFAQRQALPRTTLLFDNTRIHEEDESFLIKSSRPQFATSDDELVTFAQQHSGPQCVYVTSDRELRERLSAFGVTLMKPGRWFEAVAEVLGEEYQAILGRQSE